jgi:tetratricopeptide (TPR) repeat protein
MLFTARGALMMPLNITWKRCGLSLIILKPTTTWGMLFTARGALMMPLNITWKRCGLSLIMSLYSKGRTDDAIKHYLEALRLKPDYVEAHNSLGVAFARKGNVDMALKHFQKALQINPNFSYARDNLKKALLFQERNQ